MNILEDRFPYLSGVRLDFKEISWLRNETDMFFQQVSHDRYDVFCWRKEIAYIYICGQGEAINHFKASDRVIECACLIARERVHNNIDIYCENFKRLSMRFEDNLLLVPEERIPLLSDYLSNSPYNGTQNTHLDNPSR